MRKCLIGAAAAILLAACTGGNGATSVSSGAEADSTVTEAADTVTIAMTGDIMLGSTYPTPRLPVNDGREIFIETDSILQAADVACGNLEGVIADEAKCRKDVSKPLSFAFLMPTKNAPRLSEAGYDFLGLANNHILDFYEEATIKTEKLLDSLGIKYAGREECEMAIKEVNGKKFGFCAFGHEVYSLRTQDTVTVKRVISDLRKQCDILIVCFHGGAEGSGCRHVPFGTEYFHGWDRGDLRQFTHMAIDCGADIVYGHGPHIVRGIELYNGHLIAYSLGNFATPAGMGIAGLTGYAPVLTARLDGKGKFIDGKIHSFIQKSGLGPRRDLSNIVAKEMRTLSYEDFKDSPLTIADDGTITIKK